MKRYTYLFQLCKLYKPLTICEIGTNRGRRGTNLVAIACQQNPGKHIKYKGYDLFDLITPELSREEGNGKTINLSLKGVKNTFEKRLHKKHKYDCSFSLIMGNTNEVLKEESFDFVFIDGGHKIETIRSDYDKLKDSKVIVFDDYYADHCGEDSGRVGMGLGCNELIHELENDQSFHVEFFPPLGTLKAEKNLHLVLVVRKKDYKEL